MARNMMLAAIAAALATGCGSQSSERDTGTDPGTDTPTEDVGEEEIPPAECTGTESITFEFIEDDAPVESVPVAVRCGGDEWEETSGADGRVTFGGLNVSARAVNVTFVHEGNATTWIGYGGARGAPEVMEIDFTELNPTDDWDGYSGDVTYGDADSIMLISGPIGVTAARGGDPYQKRLPAGGTDLPIAFLEYTVTAGNANPIGFTATTVDTPSTGGSLPTASADPAATFETVDVILSFDAAASSPIHDRTAPGDEPLRFTRPWFGLTLFDVFSDAGGTDVDYSILVGITTTWALGSTTDDLTMAYVPAAITGDASASLVVTDNNGYWLSATYPDWPVADGATFEMRDVPVIEGVSDPTTILGMDDTITVAYPSWAGAAAVTVYLSTGFGAFSIEALWSVLVPPEGASFTFSDLPLHSSLSAGDIIPSAGTKRISVGAIEVDGDPFDGYQGWVVDDWWDDRFIGRAVDGRFEFRP